MCLLCIVDGCCCVVVHQYSSHASSLHNASSEGSVARAPFLDSIGLIRNNNYIYS